MKIKIIVSLLMLGLVIFVVNKALGMEGFTGILFSFPKDKLMLLLAISASISTLKSWRFLMLLKNSEVKISFWDNLKSYISGQAVSSLPGGEAMRGVLLKKETKAGLLQTGGPIITQSFLEIFSAAAIFLVGSLFWEEDFLFIAGGVFISLLVLAVFLTNKKWLRKMLNLAIFQHQKIKKFGKSLQIMQKNLLLNVIDQKTSLPDKILVRGLILSLFTHLIGGILLLLIAFYYQVSLNYLQSVFVYCASIIISGISTISPGGVGFTEGGMMGLLLLFGVAFPNALAIVVLFRAVTLIFYVLIGLIFLVTFYGKDFLLSKKVLA